MRDFRQVPFHDPAACIVVMRVPGVLFYFVFFEGRRTVGGFWSDQQINSQKSVISVAVSSVLTYKYKYITSDFHIIFFHLVSC